MVGCPYEGPIAPAAVAAVAQRLFEMGCHEVSLGDTIGVGTPASVLRMLEAVTAHVPVDKLAGHYHDTYGMAVTNIDLAALSATAVWISGVLGRAPGLGVTRALSAKD